MMSPKRISENLSTGLRNLTLFDPSVDIPQYLRG
jgi:hypothetical protein